MAETREGSLHGSELCPAIAVRLSSPICLSCQTSAGEGGDHMAPRLHKEQTAESGSSLPAGLLPALPKPPSGARRDPEARKRTGSRPCFNGRTRFAKAASREKHPAARTCATVQPLIKKSVCQHPLVKTTLILRVPCFLRAVPYRQIYEISPMCTRLALPPTHILALLVRERNQNQTQSLRRRVPRESPAPLRSQPRQDQAGATLPGPAAAGCRPRQVPLPSRLSLLRARRPNPRRGVLPRGPAPQARSRRGEERRDSSSLRAVRPPAVRGGSRGETGARRNRKFPKACVSACFHLLKKRCWEYSLKYRGRVIEMMKFRLDFGEIGDNSAQAKHGWSPDNRAHALSTSTLCVYIYTYIYI
ncbi:LIM/homeobox protein Lhx8 isoform 1-T1 [Theristicus caerulescens]